MYQGPTGPDQYHGGHDPYNGGGPAPRRKGNLLMGGLLVAGSLGGVAAIMAGLLTYLSPVEQDEPYGPPVPQAAGSTLGPQEVPGGGQPVTDQQPPGVTLPSSVGPGGLDVPLTAAAPTAAPPPPVVQPPEPLKSDGVKPRRLAIPRIGVMAPLMALGVDSKREIQTPPLSRPNQAGWYKHGPIPGQQGPSVVLGHVNNKRGAAVFSRLKEVKRGDKIKVSRTDGTVAEFTVDGVEQVSKKAFPSKRVYGNTGEATLRLVTCGGVYNARTGHYTDNIIVYATLSKTRRA
ncbi:class F sortase [Streptosporangium sp. NPDC050855]|uniref:class F sortase n=1 Tax=Streptosporangium sp. NPDC050855 TaxID=3366194 RepID=UPI00378763A8